MIKFKVRNILYPMRARYSQYMVIPEFHYYEGDVVPNPRWVGPDCVTIKCNDFLGLHVIKKDRIVGLNDCEDISIFKPRTTQVKGSKGNLYTVTNLLSGGYTCDCVGYSFRRDCKHIHQVMGNG